MAVPNRNGAVLVHDVRNHDRLVGAAACISLGAPPLRQGGGALGEAIRHLHAKFAADVANGKIIDTVCAWCRAMVELNKSESDDNLRSAVLF